MYFADLTEYTGEYDRKLLSAGFDPISATVLNAGWLEEGHPFIEGDVREDLLNGILYLLATMRSNVTRGWHICSVCDEYDVSSRYLFVNDKEIGLGDAEIWVPGSHDVWYAAPTLIYHYIRAHRYVPPIEYQEAVINFQRRHGSE